MKRGWMFALATGAFLWAGIGLAATPEREATKARMTDGNGLFEQKCRTVAGEKIYRKVENVEGVLLMKVRPQAGDAQWSNRDWPGGGGVFAGSYR